MKCKKITKSERIRILEQLCEQMRCDIVNLKDDNFDNKIKLRRMGDIVSDLSHKQSIHFFVFYVLFSIIFIIAAIFLQ